MNVIFRADASQLIGTGHVMRCLTLARVLRKQGVECRFICRKKVGDLIEYIREQGYKISILPPAGDSFDWVDATLHANFLGCSQAQDAQDCLPILREAQADWLVVDHYGLDSRWEKTLKHYYQKLMVIDDLADRPHQCHMLLDQTYGRSPRDYARWVPAESVLLCGAQYSLLRPEFAVARPASLKRRKQSGEPSRLLISMGGVDKDNITCRVLKSLKNTELAANFNITVVMGGQAPWLDAVREQATEMQWPTIVRVNVNNMAELMFESDIAIGAAGSTAWERCCLGLPCLMMILADNQRLIADELAKAGAASILILPEENSAEPLLDPTMLTSENLIQMSQRAAAVTDGRGVKHVVEHLMHSLEPS